MREGRQTARAPKRYKTYAAERLAVLFSMKWRASVCAWSAAACALLPACYADLDWRQLTPPGSGFSVMMPSRTSEESRELAGRFGGLAMRQWSASARNSLFAVSHIQVKENPETLANALRDALVQNIAGRIEEEHELVLDGVKGRESKASGRSGGRDLTLRSRQYLKGAQLYQVSVLGEPGELSADELETFFSSFRFVAGASANR